jgi:uncharacterized protein
MADALMPGLGNWVDNDRFFNRDAELKMFLGHLRAGASILLVAQRRIGKTSLMREAARRMRDDIIPFQVDLEKAFSPEDVIVELSLAIANYESIWHRVRAGLGEAVNAVLARVEGVSGAGFSITLRSQLNEANWKEMGDRIFEMLATVSEKEKKPVVIFFDEVPIVVNRILRGADNTISIEGKNRTDAFMSWLRDNVLRHKSRVLQVLTGSIGIEPMLNQAGLSGTLNAYASFELRPWSEKTAIDCLLALAKSQDVPLDRDSAAHMVGLLNCAIPHHVQMFFDHVHTAYVQADGAIPINPEFVTTVFKETMTGLRGHPELLHLEERLRMVLTEKQFQIALELLTETAVVGRLTATAAMSITRTVYANDARTELLGILNILQHDGYVTQKDEDFVFVSYLVRDWWKRRFGFGYKPIGARA